MEINRFSDWKCSNIEDGKAKKYNWVLQNLGLKTHLGAFSYISTLRGGKIEDKIQIRSYSSIYFISKSDNSAGHVVLKQNCKIESRTSILRRLSIIRNSKIAENSKVINDKPSNVIGFDIPLKIFR